MRTATTALQALNLGRIASGKLYRPVGFKLIQATMESTVLPLSETKEGRALISGTSRNTNHHLGINGIMVDIANLPADVTLGIDDFAFRVGNDNGPNTWANGPVPTSIDVRPGEGVGGADRVTLVWPDRAIIGQWLEVTVMDTANTGLAGPDTFYFGNALAEAGNSESDTYVTSTDLLLARNNPHHSLDPAAIDFAYDYNRDERVNATDVLLARNNSTNFLTALTLLDLSRQAAEEQAVSSQVAGETALWLREYDLPSPVARSAEKPDPATNAVDRLLMAYWP